MAATVTLLQEVPKLAGGFARRYSIVLSGGDTSFDMATASNGDTSWSQVFGAYFVTAAASTSGAISFDGTSVAGSGFTANATVYLTVIGLPK